MKHSCLRLLILGLPVTLLSACGGGEGSSGEGSSGESSPSEQALRLEFIDSSTEISWRANGAKSEFLTFKQPSSDFAISVLGEIENTKLNIQGYSMSDLNGWSYTSEQSDGVYYEDNDIEMTLSDNGYMNIYSKSEGKYYFFGEDTPLEKSNSVPVTMMEQSAYSSQIDSSKLRISLEDCKRQPLRNQKLRYRYIFDNNPQNTTFPMYEQGEGVYVSHRDITYNELGERDLFDAFDKIKNGENACNLETLKNFALNQTKGVLETAFWEGIKSELVIQLSKKYPDKNFSSKTLYKYVDEIMDGTRGVTGRTKIAIGSLVKALSTGATMRTISNDPNLFNKVTTGIAHFLFLEDIGCQNISTAVTNYLGFGFSKMLDSIIDPIIPVEILMEKGPRSLGIYQFQDGGTYSFAKYVDSGYITQISANPVKPKWGEDYAIQFEAQCSDDASFDLQVVRNGEEVERSSNPILVLTNNYEFPNIKAPTIEAVDHVTITMKQGDLTVPYQTSVLVGTAPITCGTFTDIITESDPQSLNYNQQIKEVWSEASKYCNERGMSLPTVAQLRASSCTFDEEFIWTTDSNFNGTKLIYHESGFTYSRAVGVPMPFVCTK
uniref:hypothetical protein n=1 Tax=Vibrio vulnificus TaxID=672 RepID=UPI001CDB9E5A